MKRVNIQLKKYEKKSIWLGRKTHLKKQISTRFCRVTQVIDQLARSNKFDNFFLLVFHFIQINPTIKLIIFEVNLFGRYRFNKVTTLITNLNMVS